MSDGNGQLAAAAAAAQSLVPSQGGDNLAALGGPGLPASLQILLDDKLYEQVRRFSGIMSKSEGMIPKHLTGQPEACFQVICMSLDARLNPIFVARHTYQTPGGVVGIDGALTQAILENSGKFYGPPVFEHVGEWDKIMGKETWSPQEEKGLGIIVRWGVRGEKFPRVWPADDSPFFLAQVKTRNSPLWKTDPKTQICYLAIRRFASITSPGIFGSSAFGDAEILDASDRAMDVTPREPRREDFEPPTASQTVVEPDDATDSGPMDPDDGPFEVVSMDGEVETYMTETEAANALYEVLEVCSKQGVAAIDAAWENNQEAFSLFSEELSANVANDYAELRARAEEKSRAVVQGDIDRDAAQEPPEGSQGTKAPPPPQQQPPSAPHSPAPPSAAPTRLTAAEPAPPAPGEPSQVIPPPLRDGKPIWKIWAVALLAPKIRRQTTTVGLAKLLGDNEAYLEACRNGGLARVELKTLEDTIREQFEKIGPNN